VRGCVCGWAGGCEWGVGGWVCACACVNVYDVIVFGFDVPTGNHLYMYV